MSLINCPECNKEISDKAVKCPNCGLPDTARFTNSIRLINLDDNNRSSALISSEIKTTDNDAIYGGIAIVVIILLIIAFVTIVMPIIGLSFFGLYAIIMFLYVIFRKK
jgi:uncharacterized membrane protein YvbJ